MDIKGLWKISEINAFDADFNQTWYKVQDLLANESVNEQQKVMANASYFFGDDGIVLILFPKSYQKMGQDAQIFRNEYIIAKKNKWKEDGGKFLINTQDSDDRWEELIPTDDGFELFGYQRIVKE